MRQKKKNLEANEVCISLHCTLCYSIGAEYNVAYLLFQTNMLFNAEVVTKPFCSRFACTRTLKLRAFLAENIIRRSPERISDFSFLCTRHPFNLHHSARLLP